MDIFLTPKTHFFTPKNIPTNSLPQIQYYAFLGILLSPETLSPANRTQQITLTFALVSILSPGIFLTPETYFFILESILTNNLPQIQFYTFPNIHLTLKTFSPSHASQQITPISTLVNILPLSISLTLETHFFANVF